MGQGRIVQSYTPQMFAGRLRHQIDLVKVSSVQDDTGGINVNIDTVYANVWASVEALSGTEKFAAHEFVSQVTHRVVIRYIGNAPSWQAGFAVQQGTLCVDANGNLQQAQGNGITGATAPVWATQQGQLTPDGSPSLGFSWKLIVSPAPFNTGVVSGMQVWFNNRQFQIEAVLNPDERNKMLILLCIEVNDSRQQTPNFPPGENGRIQ